MSDAATAARLRRIEVQLRSHGSVDAPDLEWMVAALRPTLPLAPFEAAVDAVNRCADRLSEIGQHRLAMELAGAFLPPADPSHRAFVVEACVDILGIAEESDLADELLAALPVLQAVPSPLATPVLTGPSPTEALERLVFLHTQEPKAVSEALKAAGEHEHLRAVNAAYRNAALLLGKPAP